MASDESASESESEDGLFYHKGQVNAEWSDDEPKGAFATGPTLSDSSDVDKDEDDDDGLTLTQREARTKKRARESLTPIAPSRTMQARAEVQASAEKRRASASAEDNTASRAATSSRASALLSAVDDLARPPSPVFLSPTVAAAAAAEEGHEGEESDSDSVREFGLDAAGEGVDYAEIGTRDPLDDFVEDATIKIYFQLPNGKKYARKVEMNSTFTSIMREWKASDDWDLVASTLGTPNIVLFFDGESISANATPMDLELEDDDTVDVTVGKSK